MSRIHFVGGEKGGVGKSVFARLLSQYFLDNAMPHQGLDADQSHATLSRFYQNYTQAINLDYFESTDCIIELALESEQDLIIDLPAQSQRFLDRWLEENGVLEMCEEMHIPIVYWYVVDDGKDSHMLLEKFLAKYADQLECVVVKNQGCGKDFSDIESLPTLVKSAHIQQLDLPALHAETMRKIDKLTLSFWAAANLKDSSGQHLSLMERQRSKVWFKKIQAQLEPTLNNLD